MTPGAGGVMTLRYKLPYTGKWRAQASYPGSAGYARSTSGVKSFTVK